jgi:transglutaminase-like putative cysteine protease
MFYTIKHVTRFRYSAPVSESVMEVRMQPRGDAGQRCRSFQLHTIPRATVFSHRDDLGNSVHHFDVPGRHTSLTITAEALVEVQPPAELPEALAYEDWALLDAITAEQDHWDMLAPSHFARPSPALRALAQELGLTRSADPLSALWELNGLLYHSFDYAPGTTSVYSPIDDALGARRGVCQDFAHIMIALVRELGVPCRYVSGYLFHRSEDHDRSEADASHAWVEALLPGLGWVGFDPTNNLLAGERHIRAAIGRDYADVPPTRGVFKGKATSELEVAVRVAPSDAPPADEEELTPLGWQPPAPDEVEHQMQAQQQQ